MIGLRATFITYQPLHDEFTLFSCSKIYTPILSRGSIKFCLGKEVVIFDDVLHAQFLDYLRIWN